MLATLVAVIPQSLIRWEIKRSAKSPDFASTTESSDSIKQETIYETRSKTLLNHGWDAHCYV